MGRWTCHFWVFSLWPRVRLLHQGGWHGGRPAPVCPAPAACAELPLGALQALSRDEGTSCPGGSQKASGSCCVSTDVRVTGVILRLGSRPQEAGAWAPPTPRLVSWGPPGDQAWSLSSQPLPPRVAQPPLRSSAVSAVHLRPVCLRTH